MGRLVRLFPQSPLAHYFLASAQVTADDTAAALVSLSRSLELQPQFTEASVLQSRLLLQNGNAAPVIVTLEKLRQKQPENLDAQLLLADAYRMQQRLPDAVEVYRSLAARFTNNVSLPMLLGAAYLQLRNAPLARAEFARALELEPHNLTALNQLVDADIAQKKFADALARLQTEVAGRPKEIDIHLMIAKVLLAQGELAAAQEKLEQTAAMDTKNSYANLLLAQLYVNAKENGKAQEKLRAALASSTNNVTAWMMSAAIHETDKEYPQAAEAYEKALTLAPKFSLALNNLACLYSEHLNQLDRALLLAQAGRKLLPYEPSTADTLGWIHYRRGDFPNALALLKDSVAKPVAASVPEIQYHFGMANYMMAEEAAAKTALAFALGKTKENEVQWWPDCRLALTLLEINPQTADAAARQLLEQRLVAKPKDPVALTRRAGIFARDGQGDKALATYQKILDEFPNHLLTTMNMARLYATKDIGKAFQTAKDAYKLAPYDVPVQHLVGQLAYANRDFKMSANVLQEAVKQPVNDAQLFFDLARADFAVGKIADAQSAWKKSLELNPAPVLADESRQLLELTERLTASAPVNIDSARLVEILKKSPECLPALTVQAAQASEPAATIASYEKILTLFPEFAPAQKALALLYVKDPTKRNRAYELANQARQFYPDDVSLTKALGIVQYAKGDFLRSVSLLKQSAIFLPNDPEVFYYLGAAQYETKDRSASKSSLQKSLELKLPEPLAASARKMLAPVKSN
jgi:tetratricopeptide (TPR) repeat protein